MAAVAYYNPIVGAKIHWIFAVAFDGLRDYHHVHRLHIDDVPPKGPLPRPSASSRPEQDGLSHMKTYHHLVIEVFQINS